LKSYPTNALNTPLLAPETLTNYEALWTRATKTVLDPLQALIAAFEVPRQLRNELMNFAHLEMPAPPQTKVVARLYTRALNAWGVTLQRNGLLREATPYFKRARSLNPRNLAAGINFQCNSNVIAGTLTVTQASSFKEQLDRYHNVTEFVVENGPVDDPTFCFQLGVAFAEERMFRQASHEFERVKALMSGDISVSPTPGETSNPEDARAKVLSLLREIRAGSSLQPLAPAAEEEIAFLEAEPWFDALQATHRQLRTTPNDISALLNESTIFMRLGSYSNAVPPLTRILALTNSPVALYNRALAYQCMSNLDAAQTDYLELRQLWTNDCRVDYGLGEISYSRKDTNAAIGYYESYLAKTKAATEQAKLVAARLKALRQGSH
jgi:tetratricopeptide (TPR) repeat protein